MRSSEGKGFLDCCFLTPDLLKEGGAQVSSMAAAAGRSSSISDASSIGSGASGSDRSTDRRRLTSDSSLASRGSFVSGSVSLGSGGSAPIASRRVRGVAAASTAAVFGHRGAQMSDGSQRSGSSSLSLDADSSQYSGSQRTDGTGRESSEASHGRRSRTAALQKKNSNGRTATTATASRVRKHIKEIDEEVEVEAEVEVSVASSDDDDGPTRSTPIAHILGVRRGPARGDHYLVRWRGFSPKYDTWEPLKRVHHSAAYRKFQLAGDQQKEEDDTEMQS
jgi:hypothetical protein